MHPPNQCIDAHDHDWPALILCRLGGYRETTDCGVADLEGPAVVFQPSGVAHADKIGARGLETLTLTFDPAWLDHDTRGVLPQRIEWRVGGRAVAAGRALARIWLAPTASDGQLRVETSRFLRTAFGLSSDGASSSPQWAEQLTAALEQDGASTKRLAQVLARNPSWLARAYRAWRGEGIAETLRRRRVESAMIRLRESADPLAQIALACGFCDQSHMNRTFRAVLGRTPLDVRDEARLLSPLIEARAPTPSSNRLRQA